MFRTVFSMSPGREHVGLMEFQRRQQRANFTRVTVFHTPVQTSHESFCHVSAGGTARQTQNFHGLTSHRFPGAHTASARDVRQCGRSASGTQSTFFVEEVGNCGEFDPGRRPSTHAAALSLLPSRGKGKKTDTQGKGREITHHLPAWAKLTQLGKLIEFTAN